MNRLLFVLPAAAWLCLGSLPARAQDGGNAILNVNVGEIDYTVKAEPVRSTAGEVMEAVFDILADKTTKEQPGYAGAVRGCAIAALNDVRRFHITDGLQVDPDDRTNLFLDGVINYISVTSEIRDTGRSGDRPPRRVPDYYAQIGITLNVKDAVDGTIIDSQIFEVNKNSWTWWRTPDSAMQKALEKLRKNITEYYNTAYPFGASVLEWSGNSTSAREVYIDLGSAHGLQKGTHFTVYALGTIGGKETRREIGRLKVTRIEGDEVSLCKVVSGGQDLKTALENEMKLLIISTD